MVCIVSSDVSLNATWYFWHHCYIVMRLIEKSAYCRHIVTVTYIAQSAAVLQLQL